jgi:hypothetical protein
MITAIDNAAIFYFFETNATWDIIMSRQNLLLCSFASIVNAAHD